MPFDTAPTAFGDLILDQRGPSIGPPATSLLPTAGVDRMQWAAPNAARSRWLQQILLAEKCGPFIGQMYL
jgi:hypothetical protein